MKPVYWIGLQPLECDINPSHRITDEFIDGYTVHGSWAIMCPECFRKVGIGLGTGLGQRLVKQPDGRFLKVEG